MIKNEKDFESIIDQLKKVKALVESGVDGERDNAKVLLDKLLKKYKISLDDLVTEETEEYKFKFTNDWEKNILIQCIAKFAPNVKKYSNFLTKKGKIQKNIIAIELTKMQFLDVKSSTKYYVSLYKKELELFYIAFVSKHNIFREKSEEDNEETESTLTPEEMMAIRKMMAGLSDKTYIPTRKQITEAK
jgi:hypothetical protein